MVVPSQFAMSPTPSEGTGDAAKQQQPEQEQSQKPQQQEEEENGSAGAPAAGASDKEGGAKKDGEVGSDEKDGDGNVGETGEGDEKKDGEGEGEGGDELLLYPLLVKGPAGEQVELQVSPSDTVMDLRQFLADTPETCFYTCYDLILAKPDGLRYHLVDFVEIGDVADVAAGGCSLEMFNNFYDERAVRVHVKRVRELCSMAGSYSSLSTLIAMDYESARGLATEKDLNVEPEGEGEKGEEGQGQEGETVAGEQEKKDEKKKDEKKEKEKKGKGRGKKDKEKELQEQREKEQKEREQEKLRRKLMLIDEELEKGIGFADEDAEKKKGLLQLIAPKDGDDNVPTCVESIAFSTFNPVPGHRRLQGDLLYLDIVTAEGKFFCVTAHTRGFYVNRSGGNRRLDCRPAEPNVEASTLVGLLRQLSPKFASALKEVMERKANRHPFESMVAPLPPAPWVAKPTQASDHVRSAARAEDALMAPFGSDVTGVTRDWNEELQSCRELSRATPQDRILRDRAMYRVSCEFADAAIRGAKAVIGRSLPPINPHDPERIHMFVHNSIFFSWAADTDFAALQQIREAELKAEEEEKKKKAEEEGKGEDAAKAEDVKLEGKKEVEEKNEVEAEEEEEEEGPKSKKDKKKEKKEKKKAEKEKKAEAKAEAKAAAKKEAEPAKEAKGVEVEEGKSGEKAAEGEGAKSAEGEGEKAGEGGGGEQAAAAAGAEPEQASYASSNNDLKGTLAVNRADVEGLYTLALAVIDYRGHRVIAQSIIPGILYGDRSTQMLYGSVDNGKTIKSSDKFQPKVEELAAALGLKSHSVKDGEGNEAVLCSPVESKGILGSDDRKYLLDLVRLTPRDANFASDSQGSPVNRLCVLRPELVQEFVQEEAVARYMTEKGLEKRPSEAEVAELREKGELPKVLFNPNALTDFTLAGDAKDVEEDEALVRKASAYLQDTALPKLAEQMKSFDERPMDGAELTAMCHRHGVNLRYLGKLAPMVKDVPYLWRLCVAEMVVRATKRVLKAVLRETLDEDVGGAIAHFLNCFIGTPAAADKPADSETAAAADKQQAKGEKEQAKEKEQAAEGDKGGKKGKKKGKGDGKEGKGSGKGEEAKGGEESKQAAGEAGSGSGEVKEASFHIDGPPGYTRITADMVWSDITEGVKYKYKFELPSDVRSLVKSIATLRNICLKMGVTLAAKDYDLDTEAPLAITDVQEMTPVVKTALPVSADATSMLEKSAAIIAEVGLPLHSRFSSTPMSNQWLRHNEAKLNHAFEILSDAYQTLQQVSGPLHPDIAACCRYLGTIFYHAGETMNAVLHQHRELIICERLRGSDHPDTIHCYGNLALYFHAMNEPQLALRLAQRTLQLLTPVCGRRHPEVITLFINVALAYQEQQRFELAEKYLEAALKLTSDVLGEDHVQVALCHHALALTASASGSFKQALQHERKALAVFEKAVGKDDERTKESEQWVQNFLERSLQQQVQKQRVGQPAAQPPSAQQAAAAMRVAEALKHRPDLLQALQGAGAPAGTDPAVYQRALAEAIIRNSLQQQQQQQQQQQGPVAAASRAAAASTPASSTGSTASASGAAGASSAAAGSSHRLGVNPGLRGRGVDERAARAAAEVRRKAAARGVNLRGGAGGASSTRPHPADVEELLNFINNTAASRAASSAAAPQGAAAAASTAAAPAGKTGGAASGTPPVAAGLGVGLGVGLGAVTGGAPPAAAAAKAAAKKGGLPNGEASAVEKGPAGLGGGLGPLPAKGKGKAKKDKGPDAV